MDERERRAARRLLARLDRAGEDERIEAAREEAQRLMLRRYLARMRERRERKAQEVGA